MQFSELPIKLLQLVFNCNLKPNCRLNSSETWKPPKCFHPECTGQDAVKVFFLLFYFCNDRSSVFFLMIDKNQLDGAMKSQSFIYNTMSNLCSTVIEGAITSDEWSICTLNKAKQVIWIRYVLKSQKLIIQNNIMINTNVSKTCVSIIM
jgi:hypothetical protein